ncbi:MAG: hypothetical protein Q9170_007452 [Blastenia crenularia]
MAAALACPWQLIAFIPRQDFRAVNLFVSKRGFFNGLRPGQAPPAFASVSRGKRVYKKPPLEIFSYSAGYNYPTDIPWANYPKDTMALRRDSKHASRKTSSAEPHVQSYGQGTSPSQQEIHALDNARVQDNLFLETIEDIRRPFLGDEASAGATPRVIWHGDTSEPCSSTAYCSETRLFVSLHATHEMFRQTLIDAAQFSSLAAKLLEP